MLKGIHQQAQTPAFNVELIVDYREIVADGGFCDDGAEAVGDLFVFKSFADERNYLALAFGKFGNLGCFRVCHPAFTRPLSI